MENTSNSNAASNNEGASHWQQAEKEENKVQEPNDENWDLRSAEAGGFGIGEDREEHSIYAAGSNDDPDKDDDDDKDEEDDDDSADRDWGTVDPQEHPGIPSDMDPSGPGSAV